MHIPASLNLSRRRNKLNLFLFEEDWDSAIAEIECHPNETKIWSTRPGFFDGDHESNVLPIHVACSLHAPLHVIQAIVQAHFQCVTIAETSFKRLPIHIACQFAARVDVIEYLVQAYVEGTGAADMLGRLPIHYACSNVAPLGVVQILLRANPSSALYKDYNSWLPLHVAIHFGAETGVVKELLRVCPVSGIVEMKTKKGSTALSLANKVTTKNKEEVMALLEEASTTKKCETPESFPGQVLQRKFPYAA